MSQTFKYTKEGGEVSTRVVFPLHIIQNDKLLAIDMSKMSDDERHESEIVLNAIHQQYLKSVKDAGFASYYRSFFLEQMS